ncbi:hypothetical protein L226DRAFT_530170 [Lentinus tigrinus ALCF2SS1-7]|uniref:ARM repeat-containing protein n=1 Tax=Lentinus tigrinus ALCF2SS1-6 TaxID=1328759 RepID=A0A5C2SRQ2_9APHY|nr:hypothetical protein L227DRAFT_569965 [Lentinus tigrinus ALCF2SS1-6]RPD79969.1 hypothetical protein L226DRAFT_530170 [Lentinus tigrinus ALCF2SS1-7]
MSGSTALASASKLGDLLAQLSLNPPQQWPQVELTAQSLANDLRSKDVEQQTALGQTLLTQTLTSLLKGALNDTANSKPAINELLRVAANLCMDHDENRGFLLEAGFPQTVLSLLESYAESVNPSQREPYPISIPDLKIIKTAIGFLLNASVGYDAVKDRLISLEAAMTILRLSTAIYPVGAWLHAPPSEANSEEVAEAWNLRSTLAAWSWRAIDELRGDEESDHQPPRVVFGQDALPLLVIQLKAFIPPHPTLPEGFETAASRRSLVQTDFDIYEQVCGLIESLCIDVEDVRLSLARGLTFPDEHGGVPCLSDLLTFVEKGDYPPYWTAEERPSKEKGFDLGKGAVVKAIVETAGEEKNTDTLWDDSEADKPGGEFVNRMVQWIRTHKNLKASDRDDLVICATLSLGNICRRDAHSTAIVKPPISLAPDLAALLEPDADIKVKHGVIGLLKHLAQTQGCRAALGEACIIQRLGTSQIWGEKADMVEIVQVAAIGVAKHMCNGNIDNTFALILPDESGSPLRQILDLVLRSDSIATKSEGTRVLVNAVKSLWSTDPKTLDEERAKRRQTTMKAVATEPCVSALARLIGRSKRYPTLINEGVVALSLISTHPNGGTLVLDSLLNPLPAEAIRTTSQPLSAVSATEGSPVVGPRRALDMLISVLRDSSALNVPPEVRANVCALLGHLGRKGVVAEDRATDLQRMKESTRVLIEALAKESDEQGNPRVAVAAKRTLEAWE